MADLALVYRLLTQGDFKQCVETAKECLKVDKANYWLWYFSGVAHGYLENLSELKVCLEKAGALSPELVYHEYLSAFIAIRNNDLEKALWYWSQSVSKEDGFLAKELLNRARLREDFLEVSKSQNIGNFVVLPELRDDFREISNKLASESKFVLNKDINKPEKFKKTQKKFRLPKYSNNYSVKFIILFFIITSLFLATGLFYFLQDPHKAVKPWESFSIKDSAAILPVHSKKDEKYIFSSRRLLIQDFELARDKLKVGKVNTSRFLLQRIILSNADFRSREKAKLLLRFIPEPDPENFNDNIPINKIYDNERYYRNSFILWEGKILHVSTKDGGTQLRILVSQENKDYLVEAFNKEERASSVVYRKEEFQSKNKWVNKKILFFGRYHGLIGKPKSLYVYLFKMWL